MKKIYLCTIVFLITAVMSYGQNTFPSTGNVGIGTSSPLFPLHVNGSIFSATPISNTQGIGTSLAADANYNFIGYEGYWGLRTGTNFSYNLDVYNSGVPLSAISVLQSGNVGIGTTSPAATLDVNGAQKLNGNLTFSTDQTSYFISGPANGGAIRIRSNSIAAADRDLQFGAKDNTGAWYSYMTVANNGTVGVGTSDTKGYLFAVNGTSIATSMTVKLNANWPDYVFKPDYILPSLSDVKTFVDKNLHLPDMPSEQDIARNGQNLGEMNKMLVKKVEELTLYLIEQKKQTDNQQQEINELKKQLARVVKSDN